MTEYVNYTKDADPFGGTWIAATFDEDRVFAGMVLVRDITDNEEQGYYLLKFLWAGGNCRVTNKITGDVFLVAGDAFAFKNK